MRKFHGRWHIRPHPKDPEHASLSTLDQVRPCAAGLPSELWVVDCPGRKRGSVPLSCSCGTRTPIQTPILPVLAHLLLATLALLLCPLPPPQDLALGIYMPPPFDRILKRISCNQVRPWGAALRAWPAGWGAFPGTGAMPPIRHKDCHPMATLPFPAHPAGQTHLRRCENVSAALPWGASLGGGPWAGPAAVEGRVHHVVHMCRPTSPAVTHP